MFQSKEKQISINMNVDHEEEHSDEGNTKLYVSLFIYAYSLDLFFIKKM